MITTVKLGIHRSFHGNLKGERIHSPDADALLNAKPTERKL